jgi:nitroimidazol reductase NimA-like FMN-containing flavoprotein (pyridoxamine 5'-phosphate oxidase superfamily)
MTMAARYHVRDSERAVESEDEMLRTVARGKHMTIAMCKDGHPYLVSLNYSFDQDKKRFYFHCAGEGRKLEFMRANPEIWGQVMEDLGSIAGKCDYAYRTVMFWGRAEFVEDMSEKRIALGMMIDRLEPNPPETRKRLLTENRVRDVTVVRVSVEGMTGKKNLPEGPR